MVSVVGRRPVFELENAIFYYYVGGEIGIAIYFENGLLKDYRTLIIAI